MQSSASHLPAYPRFPAKVTYKKSGKKSTKTYSCKVTVKNPSVTMKDTITVVVGAKESAAVTKTAPKSALSTVTYATSDAAVATVDAKTGEVTGVKAGTATITATMTCGKVTKKAETKVTVKAYDFQSVTQTKAAELKVVIAGDAKSISASNIKITNTSNNVNYPVKSYDAAKGLIETYQDMKDGKEYKVVIGDTEKTFTATDGVVQRVGLASNTVVAAKETKVSVQTMDANGVVLSTVAFPGNTNVTVEFNNIPADGYPTTDGIYLAKVNDTVNVDIVYHSGKYDPATGAELGNVEARNLVVTAVDAPAIDGWTVKVGNAGSSFANVKETKLAVNDTGKAAYIQMTDAAKVNSYDISGYTVESSDMDTLVVTQDETTNAKGEVALTPAKAGTAYLVIKNKTTQEVVKTLPVTIVAARQAKSLAFDKTSVSLTSGIRGGADGTTEYNESTNVVATVKDQYGESIPVKAAELVVKCVDNTGAVSDYATATNKEGLNGSLASVTIGSNAITTAPGTNTPASVYVKGEVVYTGETGTLTATLPITVKNAKNYKPAATAKDKRYIVEASTKTQDNFISPIAVTDTAISIRVFEVVNGVKVATVSSGALKVELSKVAGASIITPSAITGASNAAIIKPIVSADNKVLTLTGGSTAANGEIIFALNDVSTGWKLDAGTYTVKVTINGVKAPITTQIVVKDNIQSKVTVKRVKTSGSSLAECFEFYYEGTKLEAGYNFYDAKGVEVVEEYGKAAVVSYAIVTVDLGGGNKLAQKVNIGATVTIK